MRNLLLVGLTLSAFALGDPAAQKKLLLSAIQSPPHCNDAVVPLLTKKVPLDRTLVQEALLNLCPDAFADDEQFSRWLKQAKPADLFEVPAKFVDFMTAGGMERAVTHFTPSDRPTFQNQTNEIGKSISYALELAEFGCQKSITKACEQKERIESLEQAFEKRIREISPQVKDD